MTPRWHHQLLPGELRDEPDGRRSARDWIVDVMMYAIAIGTSAIAAGGDVGRALERARRRRHRAGGRLPRAALVAALAPGRGRHRHHDRSAVSGLAAGPALIAGFNVALRGSRAGSAPSSCSALVAIHALPAALPAPGRAVPAVNLSHRHPAHRRRPRLGPVRPRAARAPALAARPRGADRGRAAAADRAGARGRAAPRSRARCTTCSRTASRCCRCTPARSSSAPTRRRRRSPRPPA